MEMDQQQQQQQQQQHQQQQHQQGGEGGISSSNVLDQVRLFSPFLTFSLCSDSQPLVVYYSSNRCSVTHQRIWSVRPSLGDLEDDEGRNAYIMLGCFLALKLSL